MSNEDFMKKRNELHANFQKVMPEVAENFNNLMNVVFKDGALSKSTKELIALGISVCVRCEPCMHYHIDHAMSAGATKEQIIEAMQVGFEMASGYVVPPLRSVLFEHFSDQK